MLLLLKEGFNKNLQKNCILALDFFVMTNQDRFPMKLLLANTWIGQNPSGWWMSEKFDGVRCFWDGYKLWSRNENRFTAPSWWIESLPKVSLDGELWMGYGRYLETMGSLKRSVPKDKDWEQITFKVFDTQTNKSRFEDRQKFLNQLYAGENMSIVSQVLCKGKAHLIKMLREIHRIGGEGIMLRKPESYYECTRSDTLLKVRCTNNSELLHD